MNSANKAILLALIISVGLVFSAAPLVVSAASSPTASFDYSPSTPNPDDSITLDASESTDPDGDIDSYEWDSNGDGDYGDYSDISDGQTSSVTFSSGGTYTVGLRVTDSQGNVSTVRRQITVENPAPEASFTFSPSVPNPDDTISLDASGSSDSDGEIVSYEWDSNGDGDYGDYSDISDGQASSVTFGSGGTYTVGLRVTDNGGKSRTTTTQITVENPSPEASFTFSPSVPNPDDTISLDASGSSDSDGEIVSYEWDSNGDGDYGDYSDISDGQTSSVTFGSGGTYTVGLRVTDNGGKSRTTTTQITVENPAPEASFSFSPSVPNPDDSISLDASGSSDPDGEIVSYEWDSNGDGDYGDYSDISDGQTSSVTFGSGGTYTVGLRVTDNGGKSRTTTTQITVENPSPKPSFTFSPSTPNPDDSISLDASGSSDPDGEIVSYEWDSNGDGDYGDYSDISDGQTSSVTFETDGTYTVGLRITDNGGKTVTTTKSIVVKNPAPAADFTYSTSSGAGLSVRLDGSNSSDSDGEVVSYEWYVSGDREATGRVSEITFPEKGTYNVRLTVTDNGEKQNSITKEVGVSESPSARVSLPEGPVATGDQIEFSAGSSFDPDGSIESYQWKFSDGTTERGKSATKVFATSGHYTGSVTVTDETGNTDTANVEIEVKTPPKVSISWSPTKPADDTPVQFVANSDSTITAWEWDLDGDGSADKNGSEITHAFPDGGSKEITLAVVTSDGLKTEIKREVTVRDVKPKANFTWQPVTPQSEQDVIFVANSTDEIRSYEWDFKNDEKFDTRGQKVTNKFTENGKKPVVLKVTDEYGDTATYSRVVSVQESVALDLTSEQSVVQPSDEILVLFSVSNKMPDQEIDVKLNLNLPGSGVSISGVDGTSLASRSSTEYVNVGPGEETNIQVRIQTNDPGEYSISGDAVYYVGGENSSDRRTSSVGPIEVTVESTSTASDLPGFGFMMTFLVLLIVSVSLRRLSS
ncbi:PKD domain-containing protein [Halorubrum sp. CGM5_25_10-8B]|uniref:PKD domain-containing protein n=1 Tax=Halorubrum sp. CGM5_25_10-8B TaxID=2518115 RepID=UPI0010F544AC|nr:PKD domain-containing protein [Halorubrum sp. CGM5_25_10-8B]TKX35060.1 PKD domain-containing protein [Halorubrum sp. CGM5_25_10-8B]